jgi:hypothetical protein
LDRKEVRYQWIVAQERKENKDSKNKGKKIVAIKLNILNIKGEEKISSLKALYLFLRHQIQILVLWLGLS